MKKEKKNYINFEGKKYLIVPISYYHDYAQEKKVLDYSEMLYDFKQQFDMLSEAENE